MSSSKTNSPDAVAPVTVKKYSNRRLYDTDLSRYVTLDELTERIRAGVDVYVVDAGSGADLTQSTLAQIVIENRGAARLLPVPLLHAMIRMGDDALAEFLGRYMGWALQVFGQARRQTRAMLGPFAGFANPLEALVNQLGQLGQLGPFGGQSGPFAGQSGPFAGPPGPFGDQPGPFAKGGRSTAGGSQAGTWSDAAQQDSWSESWPAATEAPGEVSRRDDHQDREIASLRREIEEMRASIAGGSDRGRDGSEG